MDLYIAAQLEYILAKTKKKLPPKTFRELQVLDEYIFHQLHVMATSFDPEVHPTTLGLVQWNVLTTPQLFRKFCVRLWNTILKSIDVLAGSEDRIVLSVPQCTVVGTIALSSRSIHKHCLPA